MRTGTNSICITACLLLAFVGVSGSWVFAQGQTQSTQDWKLPQGLAVKDNGPRTYRMVVEYKTANTTGEIVHRQRVAGEYTRGLAGGEVAWKNVTVAEAAGGAGEYGPAQKRDFMEGFRYRNSLEGTFKPDFFKAFPVTAVVERNLVWDTGMLEYFGQDGFDHLKLNEPYHLISNQDAKMPDVGTFHNRDVVLEWVGRSRRNGKDCALIKYQAFLNPLEIVAGGVNLKGRSDYWGEIWVSLATKQVEYGTIYEVVVGEMKLPGQATPQFVNIFRAATLEPVSVSGGSTL